MVPEDSNTGAEDFFIRVYDAATGRVLWQDQYDHEGDQDWAFAVVAQGGHVYAAGQLTTAEFAPIFFVRSYNLHTGAIAWEDRVEGDGLTVANGLAASAGRLFAAGAIQDGANSDFLVRAYDAQ